MSTTKWSHSPTTISSPAAYLSSVLHQQSSSARGGRLVAARFAEVLALVADELLESKADVESFTLLLLEKLQELLDIVVVNCIHPCFIIINVVIVVVIIIIAVVIAVIIVVVINCLYTCFIIIIVVIVVVVIIAVMSSLSPSSSLSSSSSSPIASTLASASSLLSSSISSICCHCRLHHHQALLISFADPYLVHLFLLFRLFPLQKLSKSFSQYPINHLPLMLYLPPCLNNFPILNLSTLSKLLERLFLNRLRPHVILSNNFTQFHSAYRPGLYTETAIKQVFHYLSYHSVNSECIAMIVLDLPSILLNIRSSWIEWHPIFGVENREPVERREAEWPAGGQGFIEDNLSKFIMDTLD